jgi:hypothetical protein
MAITQITSAGIADNAVVTAAINADAVTAAKIGANQIGSSELDLTANYAFTGTVTGAGGGITGMDQWRITSNVTSDANPISANLERVDDASFTKIGTGMTVSSGIWTFPETGIWQIFLKFTIYNNNSGDQHGIEIHASTDGGSNWDQIGGCNAGAPSAGNTANTGFTSAFIDVTNTANVKVKFQVNSISLGWVSGETDQTASGFTFIRLGDT